jgi:hypothetical protein
MHQCRRWCHRLLPNNFFSSHWIFEARSRLIAALTLAVLLLAQGGCTRSAKQDSLDYEIYALKSGRNRELLASGTIKSDGKNVKSIEGSLFGETFWQKDVPLWKDWFVGASVYREKNLTGFGIWFGNKDGGFSWNWFTRESGRTYRKLQGEGRVEVTFAPTEEYEELVAVEFLDDVTLTGNFGWLPFADTHQLIIKKGSVFRLAP